MKKLLLSVTAVCTALTLNAQQNFVNGNFEAAMAPIPAFVNTHTSAGWGAFINGGPDAVAPFQGLQSVKLVTAIDAPLNTALTWGSDTIPGVAEQEYKGAFTNAANMTITFAYKATIVGADKAFIQVVVWDTLAAGPADDVALFYDNINITASVANWTTETFTMNVAGAIPGTPNSMTFVAASSKGGYFINEPLTPKPGSTLWLDDLKVNIPTSGIEENVLSTSVYPNPATDVLNIVSSEEIANVTIVSLDGKIVATTANSSVDVSQLISGIYVYEVTTTSGNVTRNTFMKK